MTNNKPLWDAAKTIVRWFLCHDPNELCHLEELYMPDCEMDDPVEWMKVVIRTHQLGY